MTDRIASTARGIQPTDARLPVAATAQDDGDATGPPLGAIDLPHVLTAQEAADFLRVSRWAVYDAVNAGTLPSIRVGRAIRIPRWAVLGHDAPSPP